MMGELLECILIVLGTCVLALLPYAVARRLLVSRSDGDSRDLAGSVLFRVGALHSLILALVFAQELLNFSEARHAVTREAELVGDIYYDLKRYDESETQATQATLLNYIGRILNQEFERLARGERLDERAWRAWEAAYENILDLVPNDLRQESLRQMMLERVRELSQLRLDREGAARAGINELFILAAVTGVVIMSIGYFPFPPTAVNLTLLLLFGIYTGLVIYFILSFSNPFRGLAGVEPTQLEYLYRGMLESR